VLNKGRREMLLLRARVCCGVTRESGAEPVGHKEREGDGRTPEGRYVIDRRNPKSRIICHCASLIRTRPFGAGSRDGGRAGRDVMIHGLKDGVRREEIGRRGASR